MSDYWYAKEDDHKPIHPVSLVTLHLTPSEYQHILTLLGRGATSMIRPGEGLSGVDSLALADKVVAAGLDDTARS